MDLSIIIVNYKSRDKLSNCLASLGRADLNGLSYEIVIVENNSKEDLKDLIATNQQTKLIISQKNLGMGGGNNLGLEAAVGEYALILNPDTILTPEAIKILLNYLKNNPGAGIVGPKLLYPDKTLQYSCSRFPSFFMPVLRRTFLGNFFKASRDRFTMNDFDHNSIQAVDWLMGSCLMFKREINLKTGEIFKPRFDERYFMYFEDTDLGRQMAARDLKVIYNPEAVVIHDHQRESAKHAWYIAIFHDRLTWIHIFSWFKYFLKWR